MLLMDRGSADQRPGCAVCLHHAAVTCTGAGAPAPRIADAAAPQRTPAACDAAACRPEPHRQLVVRGDLSDGCGKAGLDLAQRAIGGRQWQRVLEWSRHRELVRKDAKSRELGVYMTANLMRVHIAANLMRGGQATTASTEVT